MKIRLREISVADLNAEAVILLSQFVRLARQKHGVDIKMQYADVVRRAVNYAMTTTSRELRILFNKFHRELVKYVMSGANKRSSFNTQNHAA